MKLNFFNQIFWGVLNCSTTFKFCTASSFSKRQNIDYLSTFQYWILKKFRTDHRFSSLSSNLNILKLNCNVIDYNKLDISELFYCARKNKSLGLSSEKKEHIMYELNKRVGSAKFPSVLEIVDGCLMIYGSHFIHTDLYNKCLIRFEQLLKRDSVSVEHKIQCLYYSSLQKKSKATTTLINSIIYLLSPSLHIIGNEELGILCNSLFRCSIKPTQDIIQCVVERLKNDTDWFLNNSYIFICLIKSLRHTETRDEDILRILSHNFNKLQNMEFIPKVHILVYFSDCLHADLRFISNFIISVLKDVDDRIKTNKEIRIKDIDNLLWAASNYFMSEVNSSLNLSALPNYIRQKSELSNETEIIFAILLSLWILSYRDDDLYKFVSDNTVMKVKRKQNFKDIAKVSLLLTCLSLESPHLVTNNLLMQRETRLQPKVSTYMKNRPELNKLSNFLNKNKEYLNLRDIQFQFAVPNLYIGGLTARASNVQINIELLDNTVCLHKSDIPNGRMNLKLHLMKVMGLKTYIFKGPVLTNNVTEVLDFYNWIKTLK